MKVFKKLIYVVVILVAAFFIIAFFLPSKITVSRYTVINAPADKVFSQVYNLKKWEKWAIWFSTDTAMQKKYSCPGDGKGAEVSWKSDKKDVGTGSIKILSSSVPDSIMMELNFSDKSRANLKFIFKSDSGKTKVTWSFISEIGMNPIGRYFGLFMDKFVGGDFVRSLDALKKYCESLPQEPQYKIELTKIEEEQYFSERDTFSTSTIGKKIGSMYMEIYTFIQKNGISETNPPFAIYHKHEGNTFEIEAGIPVNKIVPSDNRKIKSGKFIPGAAVVAYYYGAYEKVEIAHNQINDWIIKNKKKISSSPFEVYVTDPSTEKDTAKWLTKIYYPVE